MATNPYITVPGGPEWMQKLWLAQYMQNQDLQTKYNFAQSQQPSPWATVAAGVGKGLFSGLDSYFDRTDKQSLLSQQTGSQLMLQSSRDQAALQAQDAIMQRLLEAERYKQEAAAAEQARTGEATHQYLWARTAPQYQIAPGQPTTRQDFSGGAEPPVMGPSSSAMDALQGGQSDFTTSPVEQSPQTYAGSVITPGAPSITQLPPMDMMQALLQVDPNLLAYLKPAMLKELDSASGKEGMKPAEVTARINAYREAVAAGALDPAQASRQLAADTGIQIDLSKPVALQDKELDLQLKRRGLAGEMPGLSSNTAGMIAGGFQKPLEDPNKPPQVTESFMAYLTSEGGLNSIQDYLALPPDQRTKLYKGYLATQVSQQSQIGAAVEASKLQVAQPAPAGEGDKFTQLKMAEGNLANVMTLIKRVDLSHIGGLFQNTLNDITRTGGYHGIPIPESMRPTLTDDEMQLITAMDNMADAVLRQRSGGQTAETELKRMFAFLATGRSTPQAIMQSANVLQDTLDVERRARVQKFTANHWLIPEDTSFVLARDVLRQHNKPYDDRAVEIFMRDNPSFR